MGRPREWGGRRKICAENGRRQSSCRPIVELGPEGTGYRAPRMDLKEIVLTLALLVPAAATVVVDWWLRRRP